MELLRKMKTIINTENKYVFFNCFCSNSFSCNHMQHYWKMKEGLKKKIRNKII